MKKLEWKTVKRRVNSLVGYEKNPRSITDEQLEVLSKSLDKFNIVELPAIDADGTIVAGNQRIKALQLLGRANEEIEVRIPNRKLTEKEFKQYLLTSNKSGGTWDIEALKELDIDLLLTAGFSEVELADLWDDVLDVEDDDYDIEKEIERAKKTTIKLGDQFALGPHRLYCADATDKKAVQAFMGKVRAHAVNTDMPFNLGLDYNTGMGGKSSYGGTINDKKPDREYRAFVRALIESARSVVHEDAHIFFWCDEKYIGMLQELYREIGIDVKRLCLWIKGNQNPTPKIAFNKVVEYCLYGTVGQPYLSERIKNLNEVLNKEIGTGNRLIDDVLDLLQIWLVKRLAGSEYEHPAQKPPTLHEKFLRRCTRPGDVVLDLCAGSGSVMLACEQMKRVAYSVEIEPIFCQLIINRYEASTGNKAKKLN